MQDASFHLAADDGGQDFRAEGALSTSAPSATGPSIFALAELACAMPWEDKAPIVARLDFKDAVTPELFVELVDALCEVKQLLDMVLCVTGGLPPEANGPAKKALDAIRKAMGERNV